MNEAGHAGHPPADAGTHPPSGPWRGFYTYSALENRKERMDLALSFAHGQIRGIGNDPVGVFQIRGRYDPESGECTWTKFYPGQHDVFYRGFYEGRGIWGTWEIGEAWRGGFHIWPKGEGEALAAEAEAEAGTEAEAPVDAIPREHAATK